jgi:hypothetical protein
VGNNLPEAMQVLKAKLGDEFDEKYVRSGDALAATGRSPTITTSFRTTSIPVEWEGHGGMIIPTTSRPSIGGAMERKDPAVYDRAAELVTPKCGSLYAGILTFSFRVALPGMSRERMVNRSGPR